MIIPKVPLGSFQRNEKQLLRKPSPPSFQPNPQAHPNLSISSYLYPQFFPIPLHQPQISTQSNPMASDSKSSPIVFEDYLPTMADRLGGEGLIEELCNGFRLLMDPRSGLITFDSLKTNSALLGLDGLSDGELRDMMREGDLDGDGGLNQMEFCVLMVRLSPELMDHAYDLVFQH